MTSRIYKITNLINNKIYIGKTTLTIEQRFKQHCDDSIRSIAENRRLYRAMNKYGKENFFIELIEECDSSIDSEREIYWINKFNSYHDGYNATLGGDGRNTFDYNEIEKLLRLNKTTKEIVEIMNCSVDTVYKVAKNCKIRLDGKSLLKQEMIASRVRVDQYDKNMNYIQTFRSYSEAEQWLFDNNIIKKKQSGVRAHIGEVCKGARKSAYGYIWRKAR